MRYILKPFGVTQPERDLMPDEWSAGRDLDRYKLPPQCGMLTIGGRPITLPLRITRMILAAVFNSLRKSVPDSGGITRSGAAGLATPPRPFGPW
jgi:hypothetical protein